MRSVTAGSVLIAWRAFPRASLYVILRDGRRLHQTRKTQFNDVGAKPGRHAYEVRALGRRGRRLGRSKVLRVVVPARHALPGAPPRPPAAPAAPVQSSPAPPAGAPVLPPVTQDPPPRNPDGDTLTRAMVDRLFWRAGFGPSEADRSTWTGLTVGELVDWLLDTPLTFRATSTPPLTQNHEPIDPLASDDDLVMDWIDAMQRAVNPLPERLAFFWHRHWAVNREDGTPAEWLLLYRTRLRKYSTFATNPNLSFRDLALEMTTADGAMSFFLNQASNEAGSVNENYAREFMELFCLGVVDQDGDENYSQQDVYELARAFTGWRLNWDPDSPQYGHVTFSAGRFDNGTKTILGQTGAFSAAQAVDLVLAHPSHAPFLVRKLWGEFIAAPVPQQTLDELAAAYDAGGEYRLRPLLRGILRHALLFDSLDEPRMIKPPVIYTVGVLRAMDAPMKWFWVPESLRNMQQRPYHPPNVAGWEGGLSWMNSNTAQARFDLIVRCQFLKHVSYPGGVALPDVPGESAAAALQRAEAESGSPWVSPGTRTVLETMAASMPAGTAAERRQRQYALRAFLLGGPDGQVM